MNLAKYQPTASNILFTFVEDVKDGQLLNSTEWGFQYSVSKDNTTQPARWGIVHAVGPEANDRLPEDCHIKVGSYVFIEPLMWTEAYKIDKDVFWFTSTEKVMLVTDHLPGDVTPTRAL